MMRRKKVASGLVPYELHEQIAVATYLAKRGVLFSATANGGSRDAREAANLKRSGVMSGLPDLLIFVANKGYHGLCIELKRVKGGTLSDNQHWWLQELEKNGYKAVCCRGADAAIEVIDDYLRVEPIKATPVG